MKDSTSLAPSVASSEATSAPSSDTAPATKAPSCPRTGLWALCSVEKRLQQSGFVLRRATTPGANRSGFSLAPTIYMLGSNRLEVFVYPDEKSLARDWVALDTLQASPRGTSTAWESPPTLVRSANLAAVFLTDSPEKAERLTLALTAGAPQPGSARSSSKVQLPAVQVTPAKSKPEH
ncbi:MAG: hypothetical protein ABI408_11910 [Gemmatimonadaceae bacterium]